MDNSVRLLDFIVDRAHAGIFVVNREREIVLWNQFMELHSGRPADELIGKNLFDEFPELPRQWLERKIENVFILKNFSFSSWEQRPYLFKFSHNRPVTGGFQQMQHMRQDATLMPVKDDSGEVKYICFTLFDVTDASIYQLQLKERTEQLKRASDHDGLTQLYNRRFIEESLAKEFGRSRRYGHTLSLILCDIDHFKQVNDNYGHLVGDEVLREVSRRLAEGVRVSDQLGRYGGEEFLVLLPETDTQGGQILAERLRQVVESEPIESHGHSLNITISLGLTELHGGCLTYEQLIHEADQALYQAKAQGRNQVILFQKAS
jgi:diguanylate cyclase (GGDEF)-like protein